ncbi:hypothetical protein U0070_013921 [Myodes glareolus]|uniref:Alpha-1,6-mannosyl-glycoprotein 6-beta-N-acetylglucosaminyltransferase n=1 Tax=Myodes glareolus TaxID=447135 RepID=A0AAW0HZQ6_MYOGA
MPLPFDLIYTDYHGLQQMKQHMGLSFKKYRVEHYMPPPFLSQPSPSHSNQITDSPLEPSIPLRDGAEAW